MKTLLRIFPALIALIISTLFDSCNSCNTPLVTDMVVIHYRHVLNSVQDDETYYSSGAKFTSAIGTLSYFVISQIDNTDVSPKQFRFELSRVYTLGTNKIKCYPLAPQIGINPCAQTATSISVTPGQSVAFDGSLVIDVNYHVNGWTNDPFPLMYDNTGTSEHVLFVEDVPYYPYDQFPQGTPPHHKPYVMAYQSIGGGIIEEYMSCNAVSSSGACSMPREENCKPQW